MMEGGRKDEGRTKGEDERERRKGNQVQWKKH
jgi:hypothetical protein